METLDNEKFYDTMATTYDLLMNDWPEIVRQDGKAVKELITSLRGDEPYRVLDCSCGIGTQAIGMALEGYSVMATDVSSQEVERAKAEATKFGVDLDFGVADFRHLEDTIDEEFDVVLAFDNSLSHLETDEDIVTALKSMKGRLKPGGLLLIGLRNYDDPALAKRPSGTTPAMMSGPDGRRVSFQVWEWGEPDDPMYTSNFFILQEKDGKWEVAKNASTRIRALGRDAMLPLLEEAGYADITASLSTDPNYPQNIFSATKAD